MYMHVCEYIYICTYTDNVYVYACVYTYIYIYILHTCITHICIYVHMYIHMFVHPDTNQYIMKHINAYIYIDIMYI